MMLRVPEVLDCWFESGSMSFASSHYPFDRNSRYGPSDCADIDTLSYPPKRLPADFIVEYAAQIRGWFYTLMVMSSALFDAAPFRNVICHGMVLDGDGKKLSKRLNNYVDSYSSMEEYGSDAMRFLMLSSPVVSGGSLFIDKEQRVIADIVRLQIKPIWNAYFFCCFMLMLTRQNCTNISPRDIILIDIYILRCMRPWLPYDRQLILTK